MDCVAGGLVDGRSGEEGTPSGTAGALESMGRLDCVDGAIGWVYRWVGVKRVRDPRQIDGRWAVDGR